MKTILDRKRSHVALTSMLSFFRTDILKVNDYLLSVEVGFQFVYFKDQIEVLGNEHQWSEGFISIGHKINVDELSNFEQNEIPSTPLLFRVYFNIISFKSK